MDCDSNADKVRSVIQNDDADQQNPGSSSRDMQDRVRAVLLQIAGLPYSARARSFKNSKMHRRHFLESIRNHPPKVQAVSDGFEKTALRLSLVT